MSLGNHLFHARKKKGLSQEEVAERLGISRQTVSKWETDETLPDICQSKRLALSLKISWPLSGKAGRKMAVRFKSMKTVSWRMKG